MTAQGEDQEHVDSPHADAFDTRQMLDHRRVLEGCNVRNQLRHRASFGPVRECSSFSAPKAPARACVAGRSFRIDSGVSGSALAAAFSRLKIVSAALPWSC